MPSFSFPKKAHKRGKLEPEQGWQGLINSLFVAIFMHGFGVACLFIFPFSHSLYYFFLSSSIYFKFHLFVLCSPIPAYCSVSHIYLVFRPFLLFFSVASLPQCSLAYSIACSFNYSPSDWISMDRMRRGRRKKKSSFNFDSLLR